MSLGNIKGSSRDNSASEREMITRCLEGKSTENAIRDCERIGSVSTWADESRSLPVEDIKEAPFHENKEPKHKRTIRL
jgi:hypothetical protein